MWLGLPSLFSYTLPTVSRASRINDHSSKSQHPHHCYLNWHIIKNYETYKETIHKYNVKITNRIYRCITQFFIYLFYTCNYMILL